MKKVLLYLLGFVLLPILVFAAGGDVPGITNPLKVDSIKDLIFEVVKVATTIGFYVAVFFIIYSGFLFVTARGNEKKVGDAKNAIIWTVIGTAILLGARVIADVIQGTLNQIQARQTDPQHEVIRV